MVVSEVHKQWLDGMYKLPTYEEEQRQKEWNEYWLRQWSITPEQKHRQLMDSVLEYVGVDVERVRRVE
jgi:hypothetical protein